PEFSDFGLKCLDLGSQLRNLGAYLLKPIRRRPCGRRRTGFGSLCLRYFARQKMCKASFLAAGLTVELYNERLIAAGQAVESLLHLAEAVECMHSPGAFAQFTERLRPTKQQDGQQGGLVRLKRVVARQHMLVFRHAACAAVKDIHKIPVA